jgi:hypothetical protein
MIRLPREAVQATRSRRFASDEVNGELTQPFVGQSQPGVTAARSWAMSQRLTAMGHLSVDPATNRPVLTFIP